MPSPIPPDAFSSPAALTGLASPESVAGPWVLVGVERVVMDLGDAFYERDPEAPRLPALDVAAEAGAGQLLSVISEVFEAPDYLQRHAVQFPVEARAGLAWVDDEGGLWLDFRYAPVALLPTERRRGWDDEVQVPPLQVESDPFVAGLSADRKRKRRAAPGLGAARIEAEESPLVGREGAAFLRRSEPLDGSGTTLGWIAQWSTERLQLHLVIGELSFSDGESSPALELWGAQLRRP